ncbi:hypothetical protein AB0M43_36705 [Longispora sp. NPDC051575]|uniref:hypothetical protein n=1 Tax=Longispora sp. NPDC051575 TaxID=3154943 RepID=UPI003430BC38
MIEMLLEELLAEQVRGEPPLEEAAVGERGDEAAAAVSARGGSRVVSGAGAWLVGHIGGVNTFESHDAESAAVLRTPPGRQRYLLGVPFEMVARSEVVTAPDPYEPQITGEESARRMPVWREQHELYTAMVALAAAEAIATMTELPLAEHGFLFSSAVETKETEPVEGLTGYSYNHADVFFEPHGGW